MASTGWRRWSPEQRLRRGAPPSDFSSVKGVGAVAALEHNTEELDRSSNSEFSREVMEAIYRNSLQKVAPQIMAQNNHPLPLFMQQPKIRSSSRATTEDSFSIAYADNWVWT